MVAIIIFVAVVVIFIGIKVFVLDKLLVQKNKFSYGYARKDFLMSRAEHEFFNLLVEIVGYQHYVFPQVNLDKIIYPKGYTGKRIFALRHINQKSVDFVICDKAYIKPLVAIELDDRTHERNDRIERDGEVERILSEAGVPLLRFANSGRFDKEDIKRLLLEKLNG